MKVDFAVTCPWLRFEESGEEPVEALVYEQNQ